MNILLLNWKDLKHPLAGGAEVITEEIARRLAHDGHNVILLAGGFRGGAPEEVVNGYRVVRLGGRLSVYWHVYQYYKKHLRGWADVVVEQVNTIPFFTQWYVRERSMLFFHQLAREIWFYEMPIPLSAIGYVAEPLYLRLLNAGRKVVVVSESTKKDLQRHGYAPDNISIITEGIHATPVADLAAIQKETAPTVLSLGAMRPMKRTIDQIKAFEIAKKHMPNLRMVMAGDNSSKYGERVMAYIKNSPYMADIQVLGRVSEAKKWELMQRCHLILVTSVKEGWGLIVTEAASQGTPAAVYDVDGLRDSVRHQQTGLVAAANPDALATAIVAALQHPQQYQALRNAAWEWSKELTFDRTYRDFTQALQGAKA